MFLKSTHLYWKLCLCAPWNNTAPKRAANLPCAVCAIEEGKNDMNELEEDHGHEGQPVSCAEVLRGFHGRTRWFGSQGRLEAQKSRNSPVISYPKPMSLAMLWGWVLELIPQPTIYNFSYSFHVLLSPYFPKRLMESCRSRTAYRWWKKHKNNLKLHLFVYRNF